jgi:chaperonin GroEL
MARKVVIGKEARTEMKKGLDILADAVKVTLGPRGRHAAIEREWGPPLITKDGVTVAAHIFLDDRMQNMGAQLIKSVAAAANNIAGDGTTTATVLAQKIYGAGVKVVEEGNNPVLLKRGIDLAVEVVVDRLSELSTQVSGEETLFRVATISANNDPVLGKMIAEAISNVGNNGVVSVQEATGRKTVVEYTEGLKLTRGLLSEEFITNSSNLTCEMKDPHILLYDEKINTIQELLPILEPVVQSGKPLFIIVRDIDVDALRHIVLNKMKGNLNSCVIKSPAFGDHRRGVFEDLAVLTGATLFTDKDGQGLKELTMKDLGSAKKVVCGPNVTTITGSASNKEEVAREIAFLEDNLKAPDIQDHQTEVIRARLSRLTGGVAVFKVGATSESEMKEKKDRVEDAINAVRSAITEGVVPGGGSALLHCIPTLRNMDKSNLIREEVLGIEIVIEALRAPFSQILLNAGKEKEEIDSLLEHLLVTEGSGFDAFALVEVNNMVESGIIDPTKVVRTSLEHAASACGTLLTTEVTIFQSDKASA